jgi:hypothetical protein
MSTYTTIKNDVIFDITVGGNTLVSFQKLLLFLIADKTEEDIKEAYEKIVKRDFEDEWVEHYAFLAYMIQYMEKIAVEKGLADQTDLDSLSSNAK